MAQVIWSPRALGHLDDTCQYIARTSEQNAESFAEKVKETVGLLAHHPRLGAIVPEYHREVIREILVQNHRVLYRLRDEDVEIVGVFRGSRRLPRTPPG